MISKNVSKNDLNERLMDEFEERLRLKMEQVIASELGAQHLSSDFNVCMFSFLLPYFLIYLLGVCCSHYMPNCFHCAPKSCPSRIEERSSSWTTCCGMQPICSPVPICIRIYFHLQMHVVRLPVVRAKLVFPYRCRYVLELIFIYKCTEE